MARTVCPYCPAGCGNLLCTRDGEIVTASGNTEHPINKGTICSKGESVTSLRLVPDNYSSLDGIGVGG